MTNTNKIQELINYLSTYIMKEIGDTQITTPVYDQIHAVMNETIKNGIDAFISGANPACVCYEVTVTVDDINKPIVFEEWSVSCIREEIREGEWTSESLPTLFRLDDEQLHELLNYCWRNTLSLRNPLEGGLALSIVEELAKSCFGEES